MHRYGYFPALENVTVNLTVFVLSMNGVALPLILNECSPKPVFLTTKVTLPRGADLAESVNPNSYALTRIVVALVAATGAVGAAPGEASRATIRTKGAAAAGLSREVRRRRWTGENVFER